MVAIALSSWTGLTTRNHYLEGLAYNQRLAAAETQEARAAGTAFTAASGKNVPPPTVTRALDSLAPARGNLPVRVQAS